MTRTRVDPEEPTPKMQYAYSGAIVLDEFTTLGVTEMLIEKANELGTGRFDFQHLAVEFEFEAVDTWDLRGMVEELAAVAESEGLGIDNLDKDRIRPLVD